MTYAKRGPVAESFKVPRLRRRKEQKILKQGLDKRDIFSLQLRWLEWFTSRSFFRLCVGRAVSSRNCILRRLPARPV